MLNQWFFKRIDNSALIVFRIMFGILLVVEAWGAILTGWVKRIFIDAQFNFHFIGFDFLQAMAGEGMYAYYFLMGVVGFFVLIGYYYRFNIVLYTLMWTAVYFMQKSAYNNHYYLQVLLLIFMCLAPANRYLSFDAKRKPEIKSLSIPRWIWLFIVLQIWIVYTYASIAKLYPDWLDGTATAYLMQHKKDYILIGEFLQQKWVHYGIAYFGILFDLLVIPLLLWSQTRKIVFILGVFFHLFNSIVFGIGVFPYMSLALTLFFFPTATINRIFLKRKPHYTTGEVIVPNLRKPIFAFFIAWFILQIGLPLRHWFIKGDVLWTEEGHRLSWRMMLRTKSSSFQMKLINITTNEVEYIQTSDYLTPKQHKMLSRPDGIWQFCQFLKKKHAVNGDEIELYVTVKVSINGKEPQLLISPAYNMALAEWDYFWHNEWILLPEEYK
mgnify:CR=1 FL=1